MIKAAIQGAVTVVLVLLSAWFVTIAAPYMPTLSFQLLQLAVAACIGFGAYTMMRSTSRRNLPGNKP